jgi:hypothetical protein
LALVDDVGGAQRADVEPVGQGDGVSGVLAEHIKLPRKIFFVEALVFGLLPVAIASGKNDKRLEHVGLAGKGSRSKDRVVARDFTPAKHTQVQRLSNGFEGSLVLDAGSLIARLKEDVSYSVLAFWWKYNVQVTLNLL